MLTLYGVGQSFQNWLVTNIDCIDGFGCG